MELPAISDRFKGSIVNETALRLFNTHGRRKMYSAAEVGAAMQAAHFPAHWTGWAVAVFCTDAEFAQFCDGHGISADYLTTRDDVLRFLDRPGPKAASNARKVAAGGGATVAGGVASGGELAGAALDAAEGVSDLADVAGAVFDALDIFS